MSAHGEHQECERNEGDERHIVGDQHGTEKREQDQDNGKSTGIFLHGKQCLSQQAEHITLSETCHKSHQTEQQAERAEVNILQISSRWRYKKHRNNCANGSDTEYKL